MNKEILVNRIKGVADLATAECVARVISSVFEEEAARLSQSDNDLNYALAKDLANAASKVRIIVDILMTEADAMLKARG